MKKENSVPQNKHHDEPTPNEKRSHFLSPWFSDLEPSRWFNDVIERSWSSLVNNEHLFTPAIDFEELPDKFLVKADLPGLKKEDIKIECNQGRLSISAERKYETEKKDNKQGGGFMKERFHGSYRRTIALPANVDADKIEAAYENGVLTLQIPKLEGTSAAKRIQIADSLSEKDHAAHASNIPHGHKDSKH